MRTVSNLVSALVVFTSVVFATCIQPAQATRLPAELATAIQNEFPDGRVRLDGGIESKGALFLPLVPAAAPVKKKSKVVLEVAYPAPEKPEVLCYSNGWCYLKVLKKGQFRLVSLPAELPDKVKKQILSCKFPSDLIVPDKFLLPQSLKALIGDNNIQAVDEASMNDPDFGKKPLTPKAAQTGPGLIFLTSLNTGTITLVDEKSMSKVAEFPTEGTPCSMVSVEGKLYIADQAKNRVLILDAGKRQFLGQIDLPPRSAPKGIAILPDSKFLYVSESGANDVVVIELSTQKPLMRTKVPPGPGRMAITPNGNNLLVLNVPSGQVTFISTLNQRVLGLLHVGTMPSCVAITADSKTAYVTCRVSNTVCVIDIQSRQIIATIKTGNAPTGVALSKDDSKLFVANAKDNTISVFDTKTRENVKDVRLPMDIDFPGAISLLPDGKQVVVSSEATDTMGLLDTETLEFGKQCALGHSSHDVVWMPMPVQ